MNRREINPEFVYATIPAEYVIVYQKILVLLAEYGEDMLKDCKASCKERNSSVIECYNMFNSAIACRTLGQEKKATLIINYINAKLEQLMGNRKDTTFTIPIDVNGVLKAFISSHNENNFIIDEDDLYEDEENINDYPNRYEGQTPDGNLDFTCEAEMVNGKLDIHLNIVYQTELLQVEERDNVSVYYYVDGEHILDISNYEPTINSTFNLTIFIKYKGSWRIKTFVVSNY